MITVHDGLCLRVRWCGPSSYAYADCGCDWAVYVKVALKEVQSNLIKGICNWVTAKDSAAKHTGMYACKHRDHVQYCMWCSGKDNGWYKLKPNDQTLNENFASSVSIMDKMTGGWATSLEPGLTFAGSMCFLVLHQCEKQDKN